MADVKAIRDRLKTNIQAAVSGLFVYDTMPSAPVTPCAIIAPAAGAFLSETTMDAAEDLELVVTVLTQKVVDAAGQDNADVYLSEGASNISNAIDSGSTADWDFALARPARGYGQYVWGDGDAAQRFLGFEIPVLVGVS